RLEGDRAVAVGRQGEIRRLVADREAHAVFSSSIFVWGNRLRASAAGASTIMRYCARTVSAAAVISTFRAAKSTLSALRDSMAVSAGGAVASSSVSSRTSFSVP